MGTRQSIHRKVRIYSDRLRNKTIISTIVFNFIIRVITSPLQTLLSVLSDSNVTFGFAVQLSAASVTTAISAGGTLLIQSTIIPGGLEAVGATSSLIIINCSTSTDRKSTRLNSSHV